MKKMFLNVNKKLFSINKYIFQNINMLIYIINNNN